MPAGVAYILPAADAGISANTTIIDDVTGEIVCAAGSLHGVRSVRSLTLTCNVTVSPGVALRASPPTHTAAAAAARPYPDLPPMRLPSSSTSRWVQQQHVRDAAAGAAAASAPNNGAARLWVSHGTLASRRCIASLCSSIAYYGARGDVARHCARHKVNGEGNVYFPCQVTACTDTARFAPPGSPPARCAQHKAAGDEDVTHRQCEHLPGFSSSSSRKFSRMAKNSRAKKKVPSPLHFTLRGALRFAVRLRLRLRGGLAIRLREFLRRAERRSHVERRQRRRALSGRRAFTSCGDILTASGAVTGTAIEGPRTAPSGRARRCPCVFEIPSVCTRSWHRFEDRTCARSEMHMS